MDKLDEPEKSTGHVGSNTDNGSKIKVYFYRTR